jgi:RimJ/RimL family protein N-acetyltransferase
MGFALPVHEVAEVEEVDSLSIGDLSDFFDPFLVHFMKEALRGGGEVLVSTEGPYVSGIFTYDDDEKVGSIFARDRSVAETLFRRRAPLAAFSDFALAPGAEAYDIFGAEHPAWNVPHRFAHGVRLADAADRAPILQLMREMYGRIEEGWIRSIPRPEEPCFLVEVNGHVAGVAWASVLNRHGRLHALSVRPGYRQMGVGTDLWFARMLWAREAGAGRVICEIAEHNVPSRAIAVKGGMQPIGRIYLSQRR